MLTIDYKNALGWIKDGEAELLFELAKNLPADGVVLNIGVEFGKSLACLRAGNTDVTIYGLDIDCSKARSNYGCILIEKDSHVAVQTWNEPLDLIFVDGDHGELGVFLDAQFGDWLKVGGYLLFQDVFDWIDTSTIHKICPGVYAGVERWFNQPHIQQEFEELPSVETTRVFKRVRVRVKEDDDTGARNITRSIDINPNVQPGGTSQRESKAVGAKPEVRRASANTGKRRQR